MTDFANVLGVLDLIFAQWTFNNSKPWKSQRWLLKCYQSILSENKSEQSEQVQSKVYNIGAWEERNSWKHTKTTGFDLHFLNPETAILSARIITTLTPSQNSLSNFLGGAWMHWTHFFPGKYAEICNLHVGGNT